MSVQRLKPYVLRPEHLIAPFLSPSRTNVFLDFQRDSAPGRPVGHSSTALHGQDTPVSPTATALATQTQRLTIENITECQPAIGVEMVFPGNANNRQTQVRASSTSSTRGATSASSTSSTVARGTVRTRPPRVNHHYVNDIPPPAVVQHIQPAAPNRILPPTPEPMQISPAPRPQRPGQRQRRRNAQANADLALQRLVADNSPPVAGNPEMGSLWTPPVPHPQFPREPRQVLARNRGRGHGVVHPRIPDYRLEQYPALTQPQNHHPRHATPQLATPTHQQYQHLLPQQHQQQHQPPPQQLAPVTLPMATVTNPAAPVVDEDGVVRPRHIVNNLVLSFGGSTLSGFHPDFGRSQ